MNKMMLMAVLAMVCWTAEAQNNSSQMSNMGNGQTMTNMTMQSEQDSQAKLTVANSASLNVVIDNYLALKNALVTDNAKEAASSGKALLDALSQVDLLAQVAQQGEVADIIEDAKEHAEHISENEADIEHQREHFSFLGTDMKDLIVIAGADRALYELHCPMYNNMAGADWISESSEVLNPFYGSKMLKCGSLQQEIALE